MERTMWTSYLVRVLFQIRGLCWNRRSKVCYVLALITFLALRAFHIYVPYHYYELGKACTQVEYLATKDTSCSCFTNNTDRSGVILTRALVAMEPEKFQCAMTIHAQGRLGNLMGQYATLYSLAKINKRPAFIPPAMALILRRYFKVTSPMLSEELFGSLKDQDWVTYKLDDWMEERYKNIQGDFIMLDGYPCSWTFFHHVRKEIVEQFAFHDSIAQEADEYLQEVKGIRTSVTFIGIHVRRGDYVKLMQTLYKGVVADRGFLEQAMAYFRNKYSDSVFIIVSDDMLWCKQNVNDSKGDVYLAGNGIMTEPIRDFAILSRCNHSVITIGTYGFWSAYLAGGETVYLTNFTNDDSVFNEVFKYDKAYLPEWIGIAANLSVSDNASVSVKTTLSKLLILLPFVCSIGLKNPV